MSNWIDCGNLVFGVVAAMIEDDNVRISYRNTGNEADGLDEIREAVEAATGVWIDTPSMHRWSAAEGEDEIVQTVRKHHFQPTHEIIFTPEGGNRPVTPSSRFLRRVTRVCLFDEEIAYTRGELEAGESADWVVDEDGQWLCQGKATPGGASGTVEIRKIETNG